MSTTVDGREIYPVKDADVPALLDNLRMGGASAINWCLIAADTLEALWIRNREWRQAVEADIAREAKDISTHDQWTGSHAAESKRFLGEGSGTLSGDPESATRAIANAQAKWAALHPPEPAVVEPAEDG